MTTAPARRGGRRTRQRMLMLTDADDSPGDAASDDLQSDGGPDGAAEPGFVETPERARGVSIGQRRP